MDIEYGMATKKNKKAIKKLYTSLTEENPLYIPSRIEGDDLGFEPEDCAIAKSGSRTVGFMAAVFDPNIVYRYAMRAGLKWEDTVMILGGMQLKYRQGGHATRLFQMLIEYAKEEKMKKYVTAVMYPLNPSAKLCEAVGMKELCQPRIDKKLASALKFERAGVKGFFLDDGELRTQYVMEL